MISLAAIACKNQEKKEASQTDEVKTEEVVNYASFGEKITTDDQVSSDKVAELYAALKQGDTLNLKFTSTINDVCSKKGCWMKLPVEGEEVMVRFKDYGFFMPLDSKGNEVVVEGKAFLKETSVEELKHLAEDAGKSEDEITKIKEPKRELAFEAHGVLMKE